jgi:hypothetical protein
MMSMRSLSVPKFIKIDRGVTCPCNLSEVAVCELLPLFYPTHKQTKKRSTPAWYTLFDAVWPRIYLLRISPTWNPLRKSPPKLLIWSESNSHFQLEYFMHVTWTILHHRANNTSKRVARQCMHTWDRKIIWLGHPGVDFLKKLPQMASRGSFARPEYLLSDKI